MKIAIINGPNLNLLGTREPDIYGVTSLDDLLEKTRSKFSQIEITHFQSNSEGELVDFIQSLGADFEGAIINAGAYTHTSVAIADAIAAVPTPFIEVHISNVFTREEFRHNSYLSKYCTGVIVGLGLKGYELAMSAFVDKSSE